MRPITATGLVAGGTFVMTEWQSARAVESARNEKGAAKAAPSFLILWKLGLGNPSRRSKSTLADFDTFKLGRMD